MKPDFLFADGFRGEAGVFNLSVQVGACPPVANIVQTLNALGNHNTLIQLVQRADLVDVLSNTPDLTLLLRPDAAFALFARANPEGFETLARNGELLISVLQYHVAARRRLAAELVGLDGLEMLTGESVSLSVAGDALTVNDVSVVNADVLARNGVVHTLDGVLLPEANCVGVDDCLAGAECLKAFVCNLSHLRRSSIDCEKPVISPSSCVHSRPPNSSTRAQCW